MLFSRRLYVVVSSKGTLQGVVYSTPPPEIRQGGENVLDGLACPR